MFTLGLEDAYSALLWSHQPTYEHPTRSHALLRDPDPKQLIVGGDNAGGGFCFSMMSAFERHSHPSLAAGSTIPLALSTAVVAVHFRRSFG